MIFVNIRLSCGSAIALNLIEGNMVPELETAYLMLGKRCVANCKFCAQARTSKADKRLLSRVIWPKFELDDVLDKLEKCKTIKRVCIQTLSYPLLLRDLIYLIKEIRKNSSCLISSCVNPLSGEALVKLKNAGVNNIGIGLDCASKELFYKLKSGVGSLEDYVKSIKKAIDIFGSCTVHLIAGLGESDFEFITCMYKLRDVGANTALFSFTPLKGIALNLGWPSINRYRAIQLARWLIVNENANLENFEFENGKLVRILVDEGKVEGAINSGKPFQTSGCKYCTRPFYNELPGGPLYNYPRELTKNEIDNVKVELKIYGVYR